jgi:glycosyltransferase involved in cell wall biosynthesis
MDNYRVEVTVIMPALNEEQNILGALRNTLKSFDEYGLKGEILVVNDGSTDGTEARVNDIMRNEKRVRMIKHATPCGLGASFWDGVDGALGEAIVLLPGDNENFPGEILRYYKLLNDVDIVVPFVFNKEVRSRFRNILSFLYRAIINYTFCTNFNYTNGTLLFRKAVLSDVEYRCRGLFFQTANLITLVKKGYLFAEVPYRLGVRRKGISKAVTFKAFLKVVIGYLRLVRDFYFGGKRSKTTYVIGSITALRKSTAPL